MSIYFVVGLGHGRWDTSPRMDPFLPCSSHHFESYLRPMVLARRSAQGTDRSTSANNGNSTDSPASPEMRPFTARRLGRQQRARYMPDPDGFLSGMHPILTWGRNHRNNIATTSSSNNAQATGQNSNLTDSLAGQISNIFHKFLVLSIDTNVLNLKCIFYVYTMYIVYLHNIIQCMFYLH